MTTGLVRGPALSAGGPQPVDVVAVAPVTPGLCRVTLAGPALAGEVGDAEPHGRPDAFVRLFLPRPGQNEPVLPTGGDRWVAAVRAMPADLRPVVRNYTVRARRPRHGELDVEIVRHGLGPAAGWADLVRPGDRVAVVQQAGTYAPPAAGWQLLLGDETSTPAVAGMVERLAGRGTRVDAEVFLEVPSADEVQDLPTAPGLRVTWLPRAAGDGYGDRLHRAVRAHGLPPGAGYVWLAGEAGMVRGLRRHLVAERGLPAGSVEFCGYWRSGLSTYRD